MRDLNYDLKRLEKPHGDGSHGTRKARSYALAQIADKLHELGFKGLRATGSGASTSSHWCASGSARGAPSAR